MTAIKWTAIFLSAILGGLLWDAWDTASHIPPAQVLRIALCGVLLGVLIIHIILEETR